MFNLFRRTTPEEKELARLAALSADSRGMEGVLTDVVGPILYFTYEVRGVIYSAAQDIGVLEGLNPEDFLSRLGSVVVRYSQRDPVNSMVISQTWSGFQKYELQGEKKQNA